MAAGWHWFTSYLHDVSVRGLVNTGLVENQLTSFILMIIGLIQKCMSIMESIRSRHCSSFSGYTNGTIVLCARRLISYCVRLSFQIDVGQYTRTTA